MDALVGRTVAKRFRVESLLARGQTASIYVAEQLSMRRKVALKLLRPELSFERSAAVRFRREVEVVTQLRSPHSIAFHDFGQTEDGALFIAMELLEGESLRERLDRTGALSPIEVVTVVRQIAASLTEAHDAGIVHRDLKPENIFLCHRAGPPEPFVKVLDFGLARFLDSATRITGPNTTVGSPAYLAPEMAVVGRVSDWRGDLYALGVITFEMLVGRRPFETTDPVAMILAHTAHPVPSVYDLAPDLPHGLDAFMAVALAKDPEERLADAATFARALAAALGERRHQD
jgi:eukaryotic-like serine/threonine-protein kinase